MKQTAKILDPNFTAYRKDQFKNGGRQILSLMRDRGIDKKVRDDMRIYFAQQEQALKKTSGMQKEMTRYGNPSSTGAFASDTLGLYNPDVIPVDTYNRMKLDPQVSIGLAMIKMPIYSLGWSVESESPDIKEFVQAALKPVWRKLIRSMLTAIDYGFASHEKVWWLRQLDVSTSTPTGRKKTHFKGKAEVYYKIKSHYPSTIKIRTDSATDEFIGIVQDIGGQSVTLDADKCYLFTLNDDFGNFFGQSRLKPAYKAWYWKEVLTQFMLRYFERRGSPSTVVTHPMGGGIDLSGIEYDNSEIALRIGQNLVENSVVTLPHEPDRDGKNQWAIEYLSDEKRGEMFVEALNHLGAQVLRGLLTPERVMTQDLSTGSFSMSASHAEIFLLSEEGLIAEMEDSINREIVPALVQFNFNPKQAVDCSVHIERIQYDRKRILKEVLVEAMRNINTMMKSGKAPTMLPSIKEMSNILGVPLVSFEEEYADNGTGVSIDGPGNPNPDGGANPDTPVDESTDGEPVAKEGKVAVKKTPVKKEGK